MIMDVYYDKLSEHCEVFSGYAFKSQDLLTEGDIPVVKIGNISNGRDLILDKDTQYVDKIFLSINEKYHIKKGDVLISLTGSHINQPNSMVGRSCRYYKNQELLLNQRAGKILAKTNNDLSFLYYMFSSWAMKVSITNRAYGAANQANVSPSDILSIKFNFPNYECQKKIGLILSRYDEAIENNNKRIKLLEQMAQNLYKEWFVRFRFPGYENCEFENGIPVGWKVEKLQSCCEIKIGGDVPSNNTEIKDGKNKIPIYSNGITNDGLYGFTNTFKIKEPSVTISARGTVGFVCLRREPYYPIVRLLCLIPKKEIDVYYFYQSLKYVDLNGNGTSQQQLTAPMVAKRKILIADRTVVKKYNSISRSIYAEIDMLKNKNQNLAKQRDLLLPRLMSGKLEVEEI